MSDLGILDVAGGRVVFNLGVLLRGAQAARVQPMSVENLEAASRELLSLAPSFELHVEPARAWLNNHRLRLPASLGPFVGLIYSALHERGIGGLSVKPGATLSDWTRLVKVLLTAEKGGGQMDPTGPLNLQLEGEALALLPAFFSSDEDETEEVAVDLRARRTQASSGRAVDLYLRAIRSIHDLLQNDNPVGLSEVVQQLVAMTAEEPRHHIALGGARLDVRYELRHPVNTTILSIVLGRAAGLDRGALLDLGLCAMACDVGMREVPGQILRKAAALSADEQAVVQRHPLYSAQHALQSGRLEMPLLRRVRVAFEQHLEPGGGGYPSTVHWPRLHLFSRIVSVADTYDAMISNRAWRRGLLPAEAIAQMTAEAGRRLDPTLVGLFSKVIGRYPVGTLVMLSTGEVGVVYLMPTDAEHRLRPVVRLLTGREHAEPAETGLVDLRKKTPAGAWQRTIVRSVDPDELGIDLLSALFGPLPVG